MSVPVLTAVTGARWETDLVSALEHSPIPLSVVRRCVDLPDLLAAANSGQARAVVLSADLRRLDRDAVTRLKATGVARRAARSCLRSSQARSTFTIPKPSSIQVYWPWVFACVFVSRVVASNGRALARSTLRIVRPSTATGAVGCCSL